MKNSILEYNPQENLNGKSHRKENHFYKALKLISFDNGEYKVIADVRFYGTSARTYCCAWVNYKGVYSSGSDFAGGYGYCRQSSAAYSALRKAGFLFQFGFPGQGLEAVKDALMAVGEYFEAPNLTVIDSHA